jgi:hypothetical protein
MHGEERGGGPGGGARKEPCGEPPEQDRAGGVEQHTGRVHDPWRAAADHPLRGEAQHGEGAVVPRPVLRRHVRLGEQPPRARHLMHPRVPLDDPVVIARVRVAHCPARRRDGESGDGCVPCERSRPSVNGHMGRDDLGEIRDSGGRSGFGVRGSGFAGTLGLSRAA